jgi:hypothetical protein
MDVGFELDGFTILKHATHIKKDSRWVHNHGWYQEDRNPMVWQPDIHLSTPSSISTSTSTESTSTPLVERQDRSWDMGSVIQGAGVDGFEKIPSMGGGHSWNRYCVPAPGIGMNKSTTLTSMVPAPGIGMNKYTTLTSMISPELHSTFPPAFHSAPGVGMHKSTTLTSMIPPELRSTFPVSLHSKFQEFGSPVLEAIPIVDTRLVSTNTDPVRPNIPQTHSQDVEVEQRIRCTDCGKTYAHKRGLVDHTMRAHADKRDPVVMLKVQSRKDARVKNSAIKRQDPSYVKARNTSACNARLLKKVQKHQHKMKSDVIGVRILSNKQWQ